MGLEDSGVKWGHDGFWGIKWEISKWGYRAIMAIYGLREGSL